ncbi:hypothetical protein K402DRAFT_16004 [Aulographum hederae CBS 113979]|uniref:Uncharacterized protein n=1 Tax=Aulographum hederae CBS 113979 TaxID=1176131 RepID=A0A6G1H7Y7_9PEZI|nr:hypothetical protein K402DRAFT_16004 [Aulographum hederae CBS 113979]
MSTLLQPFGWMVLNLHAAQCRGHTAAKLIDPKPRVNHLPAHPASLYLALHASGVVEENRDLGFGAIWSDMLAGSPQDKLPLGCHWPVKLDNDAHRPFPQSWPRIRLYKRAVGSQASFSPSDGRSSPCGRSISFPTRGISPRWAC